MKERESTRRKAEKSRCLFQKREVDETGDLPRGHHLERGDRGASSVGSG